MTNSHKNSCIVNDFCSFAGKEQCNKICGHFIALHGTSGNGGRTGTANIPADYRKVTIKNSVVRENQPSIYKFLDTYCDTFNRQFNSNEEANIKSMYLYSQSPGTGKTTTAVAIMNSWIITHYLGSLKRGRQALQTPAYFLDCNDWQTLFNEFNRKNIPQDIGEKASAEYYRRMQLAKNSPLVVIDDIGVRDATQAFRGDLHSVINHRTTNGMPTIYTSNLPIKEMAVVFDSRLYDRMRDQCADLEFLGKSKRGKR